jgi:transposase
VRSAGPSIDPELMIRMLVVGYCFGIRSERRLCEEVHLNLAYRWFCRLGLERDVPDHSTFSKNRVSVSGVATFKDCPQGFVRSAAKPKSAGGIQFDRPL